MVPIDISDDSWVCKSHCGNVNGSSVRIRGGERIEIVVIDGVGEGVPERSGYQICAIVTKWVVSVDPFGFDGVVMTILIDVELDIVRFLHASPWHRDVYSVSDVSGIVGVVVLVSQGYWEFRVQDFDLWDRYW